jgi:Plasmid pRiA4b ORF-3-like protein
MHLHEFVIAEKRYGRPAPREVVPVQNEALFRLHSPPLTEGTSFTYVYDFGYHWEIEVKIERVLPPDPGAPFAPVIEVPLHPVRRRAADSGLSLRPYLLSNSGSFSFRVSSLHGFADIRRPSGSGYWICSRGIKGTLSAARSPKMSGRPSGNIRGYGTGSL